MKKTNIILSFVICILSYGCTDLSETVYTGVAMNDFFKNEKELVANAGRAYTKLQGYNSEQSLWTLLLQASDECAVPACGGSWYSNGRYEEIQTNKIPPANKLLTRGWNWIFNGIAACNEIIYETELSPIQFEGKEKIIAEMKILRAFYYYQAISCWGNVPFTTDYTETGYPEQKSREYIFNYLEKEINDNIEFLDREPSDTNYGRVTQAAAYCILAKMYLNAEAWFGTPMYDKAEKACKDIMDIGAYSIEDSYSTNFDIKNEDSKENIFVILYDRVYTSGDSNSFYLHTLTLEAASQATFNIPAAPWSGFLCQPDFFQTYAEQDLRRSQSWLYGPQVDLSGKDLGFEYTPVFPEEKYYNSNGGRGTYDGARCWKWHYQTDGSLKEYTVSMDNDFAIFRYADVVLMAAEAYNETGNTPKAWELLNDVRERAKATKVNSLQEYKNVHKKLYDLPFFNGGDAADNFRTALYWERGFELAFEGQRKYDLLRWGILAETLQLFQSKMDKSLKGKYVAGDNFVKGKHELFPIPLGELQANPALNNQNNPGYE